MTITKKPVSPDAFINAAPDAAAPTAEKAAPKRVRKGKKVQITLTITESLLDRVDRQAEQLGQSRAAVINLAIVQTLESGLRIAGER